MMGGVCSRLPAVLLLLTCVVVLLGSLHTAGGQSVKSMSIVSEEANSVAEEAMPVLASSNATLQCVGYGHAVYWKRGKRNITNDDYRYVIETASLEDPILNEEENAAEEEEAEGSAAITEAPGADASPQQQRLVSTLSITDVGLQDADHYHCLYTSAQADVPSAERSLMLRVLAAPVLLTVGNSSEGVVGEKVSVSCTFESNPPPSITWLKNKTSLDQDKRFKVVSRNESNMHLSELVLDNATLKDNGTYQCYAENSVGDAEHPGQPYLIMHAVPTVEWVTARSLGPEDIQLVWQVQENMAQLRDIEIWISDDGSESNAGLWKKLEADVQSVVLDDGLVDAVKGGGRTVAVWLRVNTMSGLQVLSQQRNVTMLREVPEYIPTASFRGSTLSSLTVAWSKPDSQQESYVSYFLLSLTDVKTGATQQVVKPVNITTHEFTNLNIGTQFNFTVGACMGVYEARLRDCGTPSPVITGNTLYNPPESVEDVVVTCKHDPYSGWFVEVRWTPVQGAREQGTIGHFKLELKSIAKYVDEEGQQRYEDEIREENVSVNFTSYTFAQASANTHYTVKVYAGIKHMYSRALKGQCSMSAWLPRQYRLQWWKAKPPAATATAVPSPASADYTAASYTSDSSVPQPSLLKLPVPTISQRNGTICCYRIVVVKLAANSDIDDLGAAEKLQLHSHRHVHLTPASLAYVAEAFTGRLKDRYLILGDNKTVGGNWSEGCGGCVDTPSGDAEGSPAGTLKSLQGTFAPTNAQHTTSSAARAATPGGGVLPTAALLPSLGQRRGARSPETDYRIVDGLLSSQHNYTGFLILTVKGVDGRPMHRYSEYFNKIQPIMTDGPSTTTSSSSATNTIDSTDNMVILIAIGVLLFLLIVTISLCALLLFYKRRNKHLEDELVYNESMSGSLGRKIFRSLRKSNTLMSQNSIDVKPINKEDLVHIYLENIKDSELGFRREYEALPEKFVDRSSRMSEQLENGCKNRYPDIKAYDQTRVKLQPSITHPSDYINANFVLGYKERKKFICAQGPMDATVDDFWRMIVEQGCGICVMLTNLEENGKVKCVKYWPEAGQPKTFDNITVRLVKEKSYADYIVRTLRAEWMVQSVGSNTELNNKGVVGGEGSTSTNTSNASNSIHSNSASITEEMKYHEVEQYHYLMWKDFVAPEHPVGILAFLRRMNEAYSHEKGPLLVHCSAGVGRTGTLVALDSLVIELDEEHQASVYNLICDLRHQRNFLVQSLKQYVFIHRALMEYAQFGSTEQTPQELREAYVKHVNQVQQQAALPILFQQFDLLSKVIEERKSLTVATSEENKNRNRYDFILPYDSNRVILSPITGKPLNTYINASFVGGFDLDEHFIVTQDPLENTVSDFWRVIYEQDVTTLVMLSELGSGDHLCTRYWPEEDVEASHEMIRVKLLSSESYPKFSSRVFQVSNSKTGDSRQVTQFQYVGWSGMLGEVPVGTYGLMEIINRVQSHIHANLSASMPAPVLVHCSGGGDRCSVYVCLNNCLRHLRREGRVDVFQIARKIRSLRQFMLQEPTQYEFCYKALIEYIDSKGLDNI